MCHTAKRVATDRRLECIAIPRQSPCDAAVATTVILPETVSTCYLQLWQPRFLDQVANACHLSCRTEQSDVACAAWGRWDRSLGAFWCRGRPLTSGRRSLDETESFVEVRNEVPLKNASAHLTALSRRCKQAAENAVKMASRHLRVGSLLGRAFSWTNN